MSIKVETKVGTRRVKEARLTSAFSSQVIYLGPIRHRRIGPPLTRTKVQKVSATVKHQVGTPLVPCIYPRAGQENRGLRLQKRIYVLHAGRPVEVNGPVIVLVNSEDTSLVTRSNQHITHRLGNSCIVFLLVYKKRTRVRKKFG